MTSRSALLLFLLAAPCLCLADDRLPADYIPVPQARPDDKNAAGPIPEPRPDTSAASPATPQERQRPAAAEPKPAETPDSSAPGPDAPDAPPPQPAAAPPQREDPEIYAACIASLRETGIDFQEAQGFDDGGGCGIDKPLTIREVLPGIKLEPEAKMRCETALQLSRWAKGTVLPAATLAFGPEARITAFHQASSYVCKNRDSLKDAKISEHAKGNAIDIDRFVFADKTSIGIEPRAKDSTLTGAFERTIIAAGCLYFTTVLGPESDGYHKTHIHLDIIERHGGFRYCW